MALLSLNSNLEPIQKRADSVAISPLPSPWSPSLLGDPSMKQRDSDRTGVRAERSQPVNPSDTRWTDVLVAAQRGTTEASEAFGRLYHKYRAPLVAFIRWNGFSKEDAADLYQSFAARLLEKNKLHRVDRQKGRLRVFLRTDLQSHLIDHLRAQHAEKRGSGRELAVIGSDFENGEREALDTALTPDEAFDRAWAMEVFSRVMKRLRMELSESGKGLLYDALQEHVLGLETETGYQVIAKRFGLSNGNTVAAAVLRMRKRMYELFREEVADSLVIEDCDEEVDSLISIMRMMRGSL